MVSNVSVVGMAGMGVLGASGGVTSPDTAADVPGDPSPQFGQLRRRPWVALPEDESTGLRIACGVRPQCALGPANGRGAVSPRRRGPPAARGPHSRGAAP